MGRPSDGLLPLDHPDPDELSVLCPAEWLPEELPAERGWRVIEWPAARDVPGSEIQSGNWINRDPKRGPKHPRCAAVRNASEIS